MKASPVGTIFYKPEEVATLLEIPRARVMRLIRSKELAAIRLTSRTVRITDAQLAVYQYGREPTIAKRKGG